MKSSTLNGWCLRKLAFVNIKDEHLVPLLALAAATTPALCSSKKKPQVSSMPTSQGMMPQIKG